MSQPSKTFDIGLTDIVIVEAGPELTEEDRSRLAKELQEWLNAQQLKRKDRLSLLAVVLGVETGWLVPPDQFAKRLDELLEGFLTAAYAARDQPIPPENLVHIGAPSAEKH
jgi:hypothetical protein